MVALHSTVGTLVILGYIATAILYAVALGGRSYTWSRPVSFAAAGLLVLQYLIGFGLLGSGRENQAIHYVLALMALVTVGLEHGVAANRTGPSARARIGLIASLGTLVIVVFAYLTGQETIG